MDAPYHLIYYFLGQATSSASLASSAKEDAQVADNDRKRRAQAAAERKAKVMAQMNQMQKKFAKTHQTELAIMDTNEQTSTSLISGEQKDKKSRYVAIGAEKSMPQVRILKDCFTILFRDNLRKPIPKGYLFGVDTQIMDNCV